MTAVGPRPLIVCLRDCVCALFEKKDNPTAFVLASHHRSLTAEDAALDANKVYRTTYMFSATMPPAVERLARTCAPPRAAREPTTERDRVRMRIPPPLRERTRTDPLLTPPPHPRPPPRYMRNPVKVQIGSAGKAADLITQTVLMCRENEKPGLLEREVEKARDTQTMVFVNTRAVRAGNALFGAVAGGAALAFCLIEPIFTRRASDSPQHPVRPPVRSQTADFIQKALAKLGKSCTVLHSGKTQDVREQSILGFRQKKYQFLIATDVAVRFNNCVLFFPSSLACLLAGRQKPACRYRRLSCGRWVYLSRGSTRKHG